MRRSVASDPACDCTGAHAVYMDGRCVKCSQAIHATAEGAGAVASHVWVMQPGGPDTCIKCGVRLTEGAAAAPCRPVTLQPDADDTCFLPPPSEGVAELIERLVVANLKLWAVCEAKAKAAGMGVEELRELVEKDLALCKSRAAIRAELNWRLGQEASGESLKMYGGES